jgi:hypothetical protein
LSHEIAGDRYHNSPSSGGFYRFYDVLGFSVEYARLFRQSDFYSFGAAYYRTPGYFFIVDPNSLPILLFYSLICLEKKIELMTNTKQNPKQQLCFYYDRLHIIYG